MAYLIRSALLLSVACALALSMTPGGYELNIWTIAILSVWSVYLCFIAHMIVKLYDVFIKFIFNQAWSLHFKIKKDIDN